MADRPDHDDDYDGLDLRSPSFGENFDGVVQDLLERCPVPHTPAGWLLTRYEAVHAALNDPQTFSSGANGVGVWRPANKHAYKPNEVDPPLHGKFRRPFQALFAPQRIKSYESAMRAKASELAIEIRVAGGCEIVHDFARPYVNSVFFTQVLGLSDEGAEEFSDLVEEQVSGPVEGLDDAYQRYITRVSELLDHQAQNEPNEFLSTILTLEIDGEPASWEDKTATLAVFIVGGLDTTVFAISSGLTHLAASPEDRRRVVAEPNLVAVAVEEILRLHSPAFILRRTAMSDVEICGRHISRGDYVITAFGAANRDPRKFEDPTTFSLDRPANPHIAFGAGPHRCIGSNLARSEVRIALEEFLDVNPQFVVRPGTQPEYTTTMNRGVTTCYFDLL